MQERNSVRERGAVVLGRGGAGSSRAFGSTWNGREGTAMPSARQIQEHVLQELGWEPRVRSEEIGVTATKEGVVTLTGTVDSYAERWAAEKAAKRIRGVRAIANDIEVKLPTERRREDTGIARAVVAALSWNSAVPDERVRVTVHQGWVTLEGEVDWNYQRESAEQTVRDLIGVKGITNAITVRPAKPMPSEIRRKIEAALKRSAEVDAHRIEVSATDGVVKLGGTVSSFAEHDEAQRAAWSAPGVTEVENRIRVRVPRAPTAKRPVAAGRRP